MPLRRGGAAMRAALAALLTAGLIAASGPGRTQERQDLWRIEADLAAAQARQAALEARMAAEGRALSGLRQQLVAAARAIHLQHGRLTELEAELLVLEDEVAVAEADLARERTRLGRLVTGLSRLSRQPPDTLLARREAPLETVRSARLLGHAVPALEAEAALLRVALDHLTDRRATLLARRDEADAVRRRLNGEIADLSEMIRERERMLATGAEERAAEQRRMQELAAQAADVQALIERLEEDRRRVEQARLAAAAVAAARPPAGEERPALIVADPLTPEAPPERLEPEPEPEPLAEIAGESVEVALVPAPVPDLEPLRIEGAMLPASGTLERRFGEPDEFGSPSRGVTVRAYPGAPIIAPLDGVVRFAGPFRGYGDILIIEHAGRYHSMIGGLGRIDVQPGQSVVAGEPVGIAALPQNDQNSAPRLYFEFRRDGRPINPIQGLAMAQQRGRG